MENKISKFVFWTPRILSIIFIVFLMLLSLDVFDEGLSFWQILVGLFIHNIPTLILLGVLFVSWKYEIVGGVVFILAGLLYIFLMYGRFDEFLSFLMSALIISGPAFIIGGFFVINWKKRKIFIIKVIDENKNLHTLSR